MENAPSNPNAMLKSECTIEIHRLARFQTAVYWSKKTPLNRHPKMAFSNGKHLHLECSEFQKIWRNNIRRICE